MRKIIWEKLNEKIKWEKLYEKNYMRKYYIFLTNS